MSNRTFRSAVQVAPACLHDEAAPPIAAISAQGPARTRLSLGHGAALILLGFAAVIASPVQVATRDPGFGALFLVAGLTHGGFALAERRSPIFWFSVLSAIVCVVIGNLLILRPLPETLSLAVLLVFFLVYEATAAFATGLEAQESGRGWLWPAVHGSLNLFLVALLTLEAIDTSRSALLLLSGLNLMIGGVCLMRCQASLFPHPPTLRLID